MHKNLKLFFVLVLALGSFLLTENLLAQTVGPTKSSVKTKKRPSRGIASVSANEKEAKKEVKKLRESLRQLEMEKKRNEARIDMYRRRIERHLDPVVVEFLLDTHIERASTCDKYKSYKNGCLASADTPANNASSNDANCDSLSDVPEILAKKWNDKIGETGEYCVGNSRANAGSVSPAICSDYSLRSPDSRRAINVADCISSISDYRETRIELAKQADKIDKIQSEIEQQELVISDLREERRIEQMDEEE